MKYKLISMALLCLMLCNISFSQTLEQLKRMVKSELEYIKEFEKYIEQDKKQIRVRTLLEDYESFYNRTDSLLKATPTFTLTKDYKTTLKELDTQDPSAFFNKVSDLYHETPSKFDEIALYMLIGNIRLDYYVGLNPKYPPSNSWAVCQSIKSSYTERIDLYLKNDYDKYLSIFQNAIDYCNSNNYSFCNKPTEPLLQKITLKPYYEKLKNLQQNKQTYLKEWQLLKKNNLESGNIQKQKEASIKQAKKEADDRIVNVKTAKKRIEKWTCHLKILEERNNSNSKKLDSLVQSYITYHSNQYEFEGIAKMLELKLKAVEPETSADDTVLVLWKRARVVNDKINFTNKVDLYKHYDTLSKINDNKSQDLKINIQILEYINNQKWDDAKKVKVFELVKRDKDESQDKLDEMVVGKKIDHTKDLYLTKKQIKTRNTLMHKRTFNDEVKEELEKKAKLFELLGQTQGWLVWEDCLNFFYKSIGAWES